jgi:circadian clock protein KaiB
VTRKSTARQEASAAFQHAEEAARRTQYELRLYVAGTRAHSLRAVTNIKRICERYLEGRYHLDVVDLYQEPSLAREAQILAAPTLVKHRPEPVCRIIGDLSSEARVLLGLGIRSRT